MNNPFPYNPGHDSLVTPLMFFTQPYNKRQVMCYSKNFKSRLISPLHICIYDRNHPPFPLINTRAVLIYSYLQGYINEFCSHSPLHLMGTYTTLFGRIIAVSPQLMISLNVFSLPSHMFDTSRTCSISYGVPSSWYVLSLRVRTKCYHRGMCHLLSHSKCLLCKRISHSVLCECVMSSVISIPILLVFTVIHKYNYQQITL